MSVTCIWMLVLRVDTYAIHLLTDVHIRVRGTHAHASAFWQTASKRQLSNHKEPSVCRNERNSVFLPPDRKSLRVML